MKNLLYILFFCLCCSNVWSQFPPQAPLQGNDAIQEDDSRILAWATGCTVMRGWKNISDTTLGKTTSGTESDALGPNDLPTLSLGDGGVAILTFDTPIKDGQGPDFAIFENGFVNPLNGHEAYLELAFVAISSDGIRYVRFPATSLTQDTLQADNFTYMDARLINNLAGKYANGYGTPFDLSELKDSAGIDLQNIRYVKIRDVVGNINEPYVNYDKDGHVINEPFPSPYPTGGFDLNAVAVLNRQTTEIKQPLEKNQLTIWPIPANKYIYLKTPFEKSFFYIIYNGYGQVMEHGRAKGIHKISLNKLPAGFYFIKCRLQNTVSQTVIFNKK